MQPPMQKDKQTLKQSYSITFPLKKTMGETMYLLILNAVYSFEKQHHFFER
jgi:hypothetical protein